MVGTVTQATESRRAPRTTPLFFLLGVLLVAAVLYTLRLGAAPVERAEIYFIDAARAMVETGDWVVPHYRGEPFFDKPALTYWLIALAFEAGGFTLAAARVVPALAAVAVLLATFWLGRLLFDERIGLRAAIVQGTTLLFMSFSRVAMSDMLLALFSTLSVAVAIRIVDRARDDGERDTLLWPLALGTCLGLGFLTKGPVALLLPGLGLLLVLSRVSWRPPLRARGWVALVGAAAVIGLGWFVAVGLRLGAEPLAYFFLRENLERFAGATYDAERSPLYYLGAYLATGLPWSLLFPMAALRLPRGQRFLLAWIGLMLVPLSLSRGKIDYYLLPLTPAASIVVAHWLGLDWSRRERLLTRAVLVLCAVALLLAPWAVGHVPEAWQPGGLARAALLATALAGAGLLGWAAVRTRGRTVTMALSLPSAVLFALLVTAFLPAFRGGQPNAAIVEDVRRELQYVPEASLALCQDPVRAQRDILFFARLPVDERCDLWAPASSDRPYMLLLEPAEHASLIKVPGMREIDRYEGVPATALTLDGLLAGVTPRPVYLLANYETDDPVALAKARRERRRALWEAWKEGEEDPEGPAREVGRRRRERSGPRRGE